MANGGGASKALPMGILHVPMTSARYGGVPIRAGKKLTIKARQQFDSGLFSN
jgi:hypothetical protein